MTAATPIPATAEPPFMDQTPEADPADPRPDSSPAALSSGQASSLAAKAKPTLRAQVAENPLASFLGTVVVALLVSVLATTNISINRLEGRIDRLEDRIDRLEDRVEARFAAQDAKIDKLDAKIDRLDAKFDEMNLKLTALIAALNATDDVDAAIEGRLTDRPIDPAPDPADPGVG